jgi:transposase
MLASFTYLAKNMIKVNLSETDLLELTRLKSQPSSETSERALMVLMNHEGKSSPEIARLLKRNPHTVRDWLKRFRENGVKGLYRNYSPGRPSSLRQEVESKIEEIIESPPEDHGYPVSLWTVLLLKDFLKKSSISASEDTIERALKKKEYRYKRAAKTVPVRAPTKREKKKVVSSIIGKIKRELDKGPCEVFALDESHFSTEPYVVSGWQKKLWPPYDSDSKQKRKNHSIWMLEFSDKKILLEECLDW